MRIAGPLILSSEGVTPCGVACCPSGLDRYGLHGWLAKGLELPPTDVNTGVVLPWLGGKR